MRAGAGKAGEAQSKGAAGQLVDLPEDSDLDELGAKRCEEQGDREPPVGPGREGGKGVGKPATNSGCLRFLSLDQVPIVRDCWVSLVRTQPGNTPMLLGKKLV